MDSLIGKITLYDIVSLTIPGAVTLLIVFGFFPIEMMETMNTIHNVWIVFGLFILISYCLGNMLSQFCKFIFSQGFKYPICVISLLSLCFAVYFHDSHLEKILFVVFTVGILICLSICQCKIKSENKERSNIKFLKNHVYESLKEYYNDETISSYHTDLDQTVSELSVVSHALIQTDSKYNRIHNYSSLKSFTKNLAGVSIFLAFLFLYYFMIINTTKLNIACFIGYIFSIISSYMLYQRYQCFKEKVDIFAYTYFIDYVKNIKRRE